MEIVAWKHIYSQWEFAVRLREVQPGLYDNLEGWEGVRGRREVKEGGDICILMAESC